jgi:hypothetical protein
MKRSDIGKLLLTILLVCVGASSAMAQVKPGDVITPQNVAKIKDIAAPGVYYMASHGMRMNIIPTSRIDWPPPYKDATEKYSAQVRLSQDHRTVVGYVAGQPFPLIDSNDPDVAVKVMWNNVFRPITSDDYDLRFFDCQSQYINPGGTHKVVDEIWVGHYAGYSLIGRTEVEPLPTDPDFKSSNRMWLFGLYPILAPQDARGQGIIRYRYADPTRGDDSWTWQPGLRRIRRLNESQLSVATGAQAFDPDHYSGFNAKTEFYDYKFLGEKQMLLNVHAKNSPEVTCSFDGGASACPEDWEMRYVYIINAVPRRERDAARGALDRNSIIYVDSEVWYPCAVDTYSRSGELWRSNLFNLAYRDRPVPDARVAIYPFKREFVVGSNRIDMQSGFTTMCYLPGQNTPERECWYINMGAVDRPFFTIEAMTAAAP